MKNSKGNSACQRILPRAKLKPIKETGRVARRSLPVAVAKHDEETPALSKMCMTRKLIVTVLWMVIFAAVTFSIGPTALIIVATAHGMSDASFEHFLWAWRLILILSPLAALFLGLRGKLPGTRPLPIATRSTDSIPIILVLAVIMIGALFALGAWVAFRPPPGRPNVTITLLGYTNDATGARLARIAVTNLNASAVYAYQAIIEIPAATEPAGLAFYHAGGFSRWHSVVGSSASATFTIPTPTNQSPWRLRLFVNPDSGAAQIFVKRVVGVSCLSVGLMPRYMRLPYEIEGDWIKSEK